jgi:hypothetical protein
MAVDIHVSVNNTKVFMIVMEMQQLLFFALFSSYKIFRAAVNNIDLLRSSCKLPKLLSDFNQIRNFCLVSVQALRVEFHENPSSRSSADTCTQTGEEMELTGAFTDIHEGAYKLHRISKYFYLYKYTCGNKQCILFLSKCNGGIISIASRISKATDSNPGQWDWLYSLRLIAVIVTSYEQTLEYLKRRTTAYTSLLNIIHQQSHPLSSTWYQLLLATRNEVTP